MQSSGRSSTPSSHPSFVRVMGIYQRTYLPVMTEDRLGEHTGDAEYMLVKRAPSRTIRSRLGVSEVGCAPKALRSP